MGGLGMLSVSVVLPIMGRVMDQSPETNVISIMSILPGILIVLYGGLYFTRRRARANG
jgi:hypothetical protein